MLEEHRYTKNLERLESERDSRNNALDHIRKTAMQASVSTTRLEWIYQRATEAMHDLPYDNRDNKYPKNRNTIFKELRAELAEALAEIERLTKRETALEDENEKYNKHFIEEMDDNARLRKERDEALAEVERVKMGVEDG